MKCSDEAVSSGDGTGARNTVVFGGSTVGSMRATSMEKGIVQLVA